MFELANDFDPVLWEIACGHRKRVRGARTWNPGGWTIPFTKKYFPSAKKGGQPRWLTALRTVYPISPAGPSRPRSSRSRRRDRRSKRVDGTSRSLFLLEREPVARERGYTAPRPVEEEHPPTSRTDSLPACGSNNQNTKP